MKKSTKIVLAIALCLCLISGIFASLFMTSFNTVKVQDMKVVVDEGYEINAQVYIPKKASEENKLPLIVLSHGSYNNFDHRGRVCQDTFCGFSKLNDLSVKKPPKTSCLQMS